MTRIKICGLTRKVDAEAAIRAGADLIGLVFVPGTPRAVTPEDVEWVSMLSGVETVGVFRDAPLARVVAVREHLGLDWVQLHGDEPDWWLGELQGSVLRRVPVMGGVDWQRVRALAGECLPLLDPGAGDGVACEWTGLGEPPAGVPFGLAGGLDPANVARAMAVLGPALVDVSSGVESSPGVKDPSLIEAFVSAVRGS